MQTSSRGSTVLTIDRSRQLLQVQADFGGLYNGNPAKLVLSAVMHEHGQAGPSTP